MSTIQPVGLLSYSLGMPDYFSSNGIFPPGRRPLNIFACLDNNPMDSSFKSCALRQSRLHLSQDRGSREEAELHLTREPAAHAIQRPKEGQIQETGSIQGLGNEGVALCAFVRILRGKG